MNTFFSEYLIFTKSATNFWEKQKLLLAFLKVNILAFFQPVNMSVLRFTPERTDHNKILLCQAENPDLANSAIQDSLILKVHCKLTKFLQHSVENSEIHSQWKDNSWNQFYCNFFSEIVDSTKFLSKMCESSVFSTMCVGVNISWN